MGLFQPRRQQKTQDPRTDWPTYLEKESHDPALQATSPADRAHTDIMETFFLIIRPAGIEAVFSFFIFLFYFRRESLFLLLSFLFQSSHEGGRATRPLSPAKGKQVSQPLH